MQKDAFVLARDLIDVRKPVTLEATLGLPFVAINDMCEAHFTWGHEVKWNGIIWEEDLFSNIRLFI